MMLGGVMGGYWATGRLISATAPANVSAIDKTVAKMGLSMKKCENKNRLVRIPAVPAGAPAPESATARVFDSTAICRPGEHETSVTPGK
jgi:hypothetical protein